MNTQQKITHRYFRYILKRYRDKAGLTQDQLAELVGISTSFLAMMETGRKWPNVDMLIRIAEALHIEAGELVNALVAEYKK